MTAINPWERQPNETDKAFEAFVVYRDMGAERTATGVGKQLAKSRQIIDRWKQANHWDDRVIAWDNEQDRLTRESFLKGVTAMRQKHIDAATAILVKASEALRLLPAENVSPRDIVAMVDVAAKLERLSRGEPTEHTESKTTLAGDVGIHQLDLGSLTDEELENYAALSAKARGESSTASSA